MMLDHTSQSAPTPDSCIPEQTVPSSPSQEMLGNTLITIDHPKFLEGYLQGYQNYTQVGCYLPHSGTTLREVLLAHCIGQPGQPGAAGTGYILGWITAMQGLPQRHRLCPLDKAPSFPQEVLSEEAVHMEALREAVPSLFAHPDFQAGLAHGRSSYRADDLFPGETDHPSEQELVHFFGGQVSFKAHSKQYQRQVSYPYRIAFALAQLNEAVAKLGVWPASTDDLAPASEKNVTA